MPRRQFFRDLNEAQEEALPQGILQLRHGEDDGHVQFTFAASAGTDDSPMKPFVITAMVPELSEYPGSHSYIIFVDDDAPAHMSNAVQNLRVEGKTIFELLGIVAATLNCLQPSPDLHILQDNDTEMTYEDFDSDGFDPTEDEIDDEIYGFSEGLTAERISGATSDIRHQHTKATPEVRHRIREDLRITKMAGFRVGHLGSLMEGGNAFVTVAIRLSRLRISAEAMQAWQINPSHYLILIIRYPSGYKVQEELLKCKDSQQLPLYLRMRVVTGCYYKPTLQEAEKSFANTKPEESKLEGAAGRACWSVHETFISKPLSRLLEECLLRLIHLRQHTNLSWLGAECRLADYMDGHLKSDVADQIPKSYYERQETNAGLPKVLQEDYCMKIVGGSSFPLLAMQFMLRHFARCTEFCLVCHRKLDSDVQAIKPYVCSRPLCLYQYMNLGFGPSIEHEISSQPFVVDLLVSLCYHSTVSQRLRDLPDGLDFKVPPDKYIGSSESPAERPYHDITCPSETREVGFDPDINEILFNDTSKPCPVRKNDWIVLTIGKLDHTSREPELHCRVKDASLYPTVRVDHPIRLAKRMQHPHGQSNVAQKPHDTQLNSLPAKSGWLKARLEVYSQDFDSLASKQDKMTAIARLLDTLPTVIEMQSYIRQEELGAWSSRISPHALKVLRWIIASNRACIMQVDGDSTDMQGVNVINTAERVYGMKGYVQFRLAMGAPDKEQRFVQEVRRTQQRLNLQYPTLFAFHGSPLHNWHMIIREGLHFNRVDHGRAYGDGVYHATDAGVSMAYSSARGHLSQEMWQNTALRPSSILALSEIVNAPDEFMSRDPYYVVQHLDWIQTRYLFVECRPEVQSLQEIRETTPTRAHPQDPTRTPRGTDRKLLVIPASAIRTNHLIRNDGKRSDITTPTKKQRTKLSGEFSASAGNHDADIDTDGTQSEATEAEDLQILLEDEPAQALAEVLAPETDFVPGTLDSSKLPLMPTPTYATSATTRALMKELKDLQRVQGTTAPSHLGWFIDMDQIDNPYQWIVQLHSFHTFDSDGRKLPLVDDMKKRGVTSIVLETRFSKDFPFTPPYIRVIRPRFKTLTEGGGGHVVMGGAMCMELLTNNGWVAANSMESVLLQVRMAIASEPHARLAQHAREDYGVAEGAEGYIRACNTHGWQIPPGFKEMAYGMPQRAEEKF